MKRRAGIFLLLILIIFCASVQAQPVLEKVVQQQDSPAITSSAPIDEPEEEEPDLQPGYVTVNFKDADIRAVLNYLSDVGGVDIVPSPNVSGSVTLKLTNKPWQTALEIIVKNYGFAYEKDEGLIRIVTVDELKMEELTTEVVDLNYTRAADVVEPLKNMLTSRGKVTTDERTNVLVITDVPQTIYKIKKVIKRLDRRTPQIMIEAKIIETELGRNEKMGIDWSIYVGFSGAARPHTFPFYNFNADWGFGSSLLNKFFPVGTTGSASSTVGSGGAVTQDTPGEFPTGDGLINSATRAFPFVTTDDFTFGTLDFSNFKAVIDFLKTRSNTEIISNPRITTLNNKTAKILVGTVYNFPTFNQVEDTGRWVISGYQSKELGIRLLVTPNVNDQGEIVVSLRPEISNYLGVEVISAELSAPRWSTREAETQVMIKDGQTIFIGGLIKEDVIKTNSKFPILGDFLGDLPVLGNAFKYTSVTKTKTELIFFITVHIIKEPKELMQMTTAQSFLPQEIVIPRRRRAPRSRVESGSFHTEDKVEPAPRKRPERTIKRKKRKSEHRKPWLDFRK